MTGELKDLVSVKRAHSLNDDRVTALVDAVVTKWIVLFDRVQLGKLKREQNCVNRVLLPPTEVVCDHKFSIGDYEFPSSAEP